MWAYIFVTGSSPIISHLQHNLKSSWAPISLSEVKLSPTATTKTEERSKSSLI